MEFVMRKKRKRIKVELVVKCDGTVNKYIRPLTCTNVQNILKLQSSKNNAKE